MTSRTSERQRKPAARATPRRGPAPDLPGARIAFGPINYALLGAAVLAIVVGYVLLSRGSITLAPILLILGYVVLLPAGILVRRELRRSSPGE